METVKGYDGDSIDWRGINPDGTPDERMLADMTRAIVEAVSPERIILFGSAARGEMRAKSDLDVLIVKEGDHYRTVSRKIYLGLPRRRRAVNLVVATNEDIDRHRDAPYYVIQTALREGRVLYDANAQT
jgi:predicted nucleotidyltransferase